MKKDKKKRIQKRHERGQGIYLRSMRSLSKVALKKKAKLIDLSELPGMVGKIRLDFFTENLNKVDLISERKVEKAKINRTYLQNY